MSNKRSRMANSANSNGSQFFITLNATPWLDGANVAFGQVVSGQEIVDLMGPLGSASGRPSASIIVADCGIIPEDAGFIKSKL